MIDNTTFYLAILVALVIAIIIVNEYLVRAEDDPTEETFDTADWKRQDSGKRQPPEAPGVSVADQLDQYFEYRHPAPKIQYGRATASSMVNLMERGGQF